MPLIALSTGASTEDARTDTLFFSPVCFVSISRTNRINNYVHYGVFLGVRFVLFVVVCLVVVFVSFCPHRACTELLVQGEMKDKQTTKCKLQPLT